MTGIVSLVFAVMTMVRLTFIIFLTFSIVKFPYLLVNSFAMIMFRVQMIRSDSRAIISHMILHLIRKIIAERIAKL